jgi:hypothetical protein
MTYRCTDRRCKREGVRALALTVGKQPVLVVCEKHLPAWAKGDVLRPGRFNGRHLYRVIDLATKREIEVDHTLPAWTRAELLVALNDR